jgi:hypothetical protein
MSHSSPLFLTFSSFLSSPLPSRVLNFLFLAHLPKAPPATQAGCKVKLEQISFVVFVVVVVVVVVVFVVIYSH